jgi:Fe-S oxidoreductase
MYAYTTTTTTTFACTRNDQVCLAEYIVPGNQGEMGPRTRHTACHRKRHQNITSRLIKLIHNTGGITEMERLIHRCTDVNRRSPMSVQEWP